MSDHRPNETRFEDDRSLELAAAYALGVFDEQEERELRDMVGGDLDDIVREFELAAAALTTALPTAAPAIPAHLKDKLRRSGADWAGQAKARPTTTDRGALRLAHERAPGAPAMTTRPAGWKVWGGWVAAAACLSLAAIGWWSNRPAPSAPAATLGFRAEPGADQDRLAELRSRLIFWANQEQGDAILASWTPTETPDATASGAGGDIIWSTTHQAGYMRIEGLAPNDPGVYQYQLWIFDEDQKHPVDGGVFDMPAGAQGKDILVRVDPKISVRKPTLFAVTVERPGGVVVSDRERIALVAPELKLLIDCLPPAGGR